MSVPERWAKTQEQIERLHRARIQAGLCAWCGRALDDDEPVYVERLLVGEKRPRYRGGAAHRSVSYAPVGAECASAELLRRSEGQDPDPCVGCGRGVYYRARRPTRRVSVCSRLCQHRRENAGRRERVSVPTARVRPRAGGSSEPPPGAEHWGARLTWYREGLGLSRADLAAALAAEGRRTRSEDIRHWEKSASPRIKTFGALARVLGVSMEELLYGEEEAERIAEERSDRGN